MPSGKFIEESINTASWLKLISNLQRLGATFKDTLADKEPPTKSGIKKNEFTKNKNIGV